MFSCTSMFGCACNKHTFVKRCSAILDRSQIFIRRSVDKSLSAEVALTGNIFQVK